VSSDLAFDELFCRQTNVLCDLAQQGRRDVAPGVKWNRRPATVCMTELLVGALLANFRETQGLEKGNDFPWLRVGRAPLRHLDGLDRDEFGLELGLAILEQHAHDFL
jgi:hypothetical protein